MLSIRSKSLLKVLITQIICSSIVLVCLLYHYTENDLFIVVTNLLKDKSNSHLHTLMSMHSRFKNIYIKFDTLQSSNGRTGHQMKNFVTGVIIANILNGILLNPTKKQFIEARKLFDLNKIGNSKVKCKTNSKHIVLNERHSEGIRNYSYLTDYILNKIKDKSTTTDNADLCIHIDNMFRVHMLHMFEWESFGYIPYGTYNKVRQQILKGASHLYNNTKNTYWNKYNNSNTTVVVHMRRGDRGRWLKTKNLLSIQMKNHNKLMYLIYQNNTEINNTIQYFIITEPVYKHSKDVFEHGCDFVKMNQLNVKCSVHSKSLMEDFIAMIQSDIFVMADSGFSHWAALLGQHKQIYIMLLLSNLPSPIYEQFVPQKAIEFTSIGLNLICFGLLQSNTNATNLQLKPTGCNCQEMKRFNLTN